MDDPRKRLSDDDRRSRAIIHGLEHYEHAAQARFTSTQRKQVTGFPIPLTKKSEIREPFEDWITH